MRIIIDVTQLAGWQGKLTGIPRVMYEVCARYAVSAHEVHFLGWDEGRAKYWDLPFDSLYDKPSNVKKPEQVKEASVRVETAKEVSSLSRPRLSRRSLFKIKHSMKKAVSLQKKDYGFTFEKNDIFIVLWGEWGSAPYRRMLTHAVTISDVKLYQFSYDMLPLVTPQYSSHSTLSLELYSKEVYPLAKRIIAISNNTKDDVETWLKDHRLHCPPVDVIRLGEDFSKLKEVKPKIDFFNKKQNFILCVGTIESRKNHTVLYYAYKLAWSRGITLPRLVIVGRRGWLTDDIYELMTNDPMTKDQFIFLHDASDEELSWLYSNAQFTVYPSHYEGWGLPIAESIAHGTPCIASDSSSMPEIAGNIISYFTPTSTDECLNAIIYLSNDQHREKARKALMRYKPTTWDQTVDQIRDSIEGNND